jgi:hypothetical protein
VLSTRDFLSLNATLLAANGAIVHEMAPVRVLPWTSDKAKLMHSNALFVSSFDVGLSAASKQCHLRALLHSYFFTM